MLVHQNRRQNVFNKGELRLCKRSLILQFYLFIVFDISIWGLSLPRGNGTVVHTVFSFFGTEKNIQR